jgi:Fe2+ transport system protein FeoA
MSDAPRNPEPIRLPLTQLKRGDRARVAGTSLTEDDKAVLRAMGLDETCEFTVCRNGSGGPCIIQVDATRLGLSAELARRILTRPCDCPDADHCAARDATPEPPAHAASPVSSQPRLERDQSSGT